MTVDQMNNFGSILDDLIAVYKHADKDVGILNSRSIPNGFYERDAGLILTSLSEYVGKQKNTDRSSILEKYGDGKYKSAYIIYHDLKVACSIAIQEHDINSDKYREIDFFYKFATELLLRETSRLKIVLYDARDKKSIASDLENQLSDEFGKISSSYNLSNGEVLTFISKSEVNPYPQSYPALYQPQPQQDQRKSQPLFTTLTKKSELDGRATIVPDPYHVSKVIPLNKNTARSTSTFESLSPSITKIPPPIAQPTQILKDYFHPNWYTIYVPSWLTYKQKVLKPPVTSSLLTDSKDQDLRVTSKTIDVNKSFAHTIDSKRAIVTSELKSNVWLNHLGFKEIQKIKKEYINKISPTNEINDAPLESIEKVDEDKDELEISESDVLKEEIKDIEYKQQNQINIDDIVQWDPEKIKQLDILKKEKEQITRSPRELQSIISANILKLNKIRQERYLSSNPQNIIAPGGKEIALYNKIVKLLSFCIEFEGTSKSNFIKHLSKKIPVLTTEYTGTLPGASQTRLPVGPKPGRLPSIRGPYKKKNKQLQ